MTDETKVGHGFEKCALWHLSEGRMGTPPGHENCHTPSCGLPRSAHHGESVSGVSMTEYLSGFDAEGVKRDAEIAEEPDERDLIAARVHLQATETGVFSLGRTHEDRVMALASLLSHVRSEGGGEKRSPGCSCDARTLRLGMSAVWCNADCARRFPLDPEASAPSGEKGWQQGAEALGSVYNRLDWCRRTLDAADVPRSEIIAVRGAISTCLEILRRLPEPPK